MKTIQEKRKRSRELHARRIADGICIRCKCRATDGYRTCPRCREIRTKQAARYTVRKKAANDKFGMCMYCCEREAMPGKRRCAVCAERRDEATKRSIAKLVAQGRCIKCGKQARDDRKHCQVCLGQAKERMRQRKLKGLE